VDVVNTLPDGIAGKENPLLRISSPLLFIPKLEGPDKFDNLRLFTVRLVMDPDGDWIKPKTLTNGACKETPVDWRIIELFDTVIFELGYPITDVPPLFTTILLSLYPNLVPVGFNFKVSIKDPLFSTLTENSPLVDPADAETAVPSSLT